MPPDWELGFRSVLVNCGKAFNKRKTGVGTDCEQFLIFF